LQALFCLIFPILVTRPKIRGTLTVALSWPRWRLARRNATPIGTPAHPFWAVPAGRGPLDFGRHCVRPAGPMTATLLPPRRTELILDRGVVEDPRTGDFYTLGPEESFLFAGLDGRRSATELVNPFRRNSASTADRGLGRFPRPGSRPRPSGRLGRRDRRHRGRFDHHGRRHVTLSASDTGVCGVWQNRQPRCCPCGGPTSSSAPPRIMARTSSRIRGPAVFRPRSGRSIPASGSRSPANCPGAGSSV